MAKFLSGDRVECLNEIRPGKICGTHLTPGWTWCPVCGERTMTRPIHSENDDQPRDHDDPRDHDVVAPGRRPRLLPLKCSAFNGFAFSYALESH